MIAKFDARNEPALRRLVAGGAQLREFPRPLLETLWGHAQSLYGDIGRANADFRRVHEHYTSFQRRAMGMMRIQEHSFDSMMAHLLRPRPGAAGRQ
jgi:TRAP-type mannitol/chloroaromatic compound transport system substrate-binding protein